MPAPVIRQARSLALVALTGLLVLTSLWGLNSGAMDISIAQVTGAIGRWIAGDALSSEDHVVLMLRLPRVGMAVLVGAALACGGTTMQGLFRNPLADPGLIGVSAGAALGAVGMIVLGHRLGAWLPEGSASYRVAAAAFVGGLAATALVYAIGRRRQGVATLLLAGVAINAMAMAGVGMLTFLASENQLRDLTFWTLGSLGGSDWSKIGLVAPLILAPLLVLPQLARALNALLLGEHEATLMGFRPGRLQPLLVVLVALMVSAAVAMTGVIGFVGLVVPHVLRLIWGPDHRLLLPASALGGAALLVAADTLARVVVVPAELPIGVLTALIGGPFFLWLLLRHRVGEGA
ncbi:iron ABC transporter permease [Dyella terrae]|uniref:Iron ABC transporter permease n=3 Tax=Rhodanobacteraceae TaxID=1775411 RepID=A0A4R0YS67_9GAMM|nr:iron ABC transporter permease [Dyella terrae]TCI08733.1 iron ABC transporter permease [Dyella soli]